MPEVQKDIYGNNDRKIFQLLMVAPAFNQTINTTTETVHQLMNIKIGIW